MSARRRLSKSVRKFLRREKSRIRREVSDQAEREKQVGALMSEYHKKQ